MATTNNKTRRVKEEPVEDATVQVEEPVEKEVKQKLRPKDIDPNEYVIVKNGFQGRLVYISPRTGEQFKWSEFGDELEMELRELRTAKSRYKKFFEQNWFMFDEDWIPAYLGVAEYYKHAIDLDKFEEIFKKSPEEIKEIVNNVSKGQKKSIAYLAKRMIADEKIDSLSVIHALEESLNTELIEK